MLVIPDKVEILHDKIPHFVRSDNFYSFEND